MSRVRVAFVNGGILGLTSFAHFIRWAVSDYPGIDAEHVVLSENLSTTDRVIRRVMCQRLWPDPHGFHNLDFARFRQELHAGVLARRRLNRLGARSFDVLHFHRQATAYASLDVMRDVPSIVSLDCTQTCVLQTVRSRLERRTIEPNVRRDGAVFRRAAALVSTSRWAADDVRRMYPDLDRPIEVMPNPVMLDEFDQHWIEERARRAADGVKPRLLFMGGDFPRKGGYDLLEAWQAGRLHERASLMLVTDWPIPARLPEGVGHASGVSGHTPEWRDRWRQADIFVMPTRNEAFGLVYQEAAAAGLPAIGTNLNAVPEIIGDEVTGLLVPAGDRDALIRAMNRVIESPALRERMGRAARSRIASEASPSSYARRLVELIEDVSRRGPRQGGGS